MLFTHEEVMVSLENCDRSHVNRNMRRDGLDKVSEHICLLNISRVHLQVRRCQESQL